MSWKIRHQGSPKAVENLTLQQIVEGLQDGLWEPTDEVMGPGEAQWVAIESHPKLEEIAAEIEPPPPRSESDETRLDMTPLIDVCLVLLIVMILTISYTAVQKQLEAAQVPREDQKKRQIRKVNIDEAKKAMIIVRVSMENDKPMIRVEDQVVPEDRLEAELRQLMAHKLELLIEWGPGVRRKTIVRIQDAATAVGISKMLVTTPKIPAPPSP